MQDLFTMGSNVEKKNGATYLRSTLCVIFGVREECLTFAFLKSMESLQNLVTDVRDPDINVCFKMVLLFCICVGSLCSAYVIMGDETRFCCAVNLRKLEANWKYFDWYC